MGIRCFIAIELGEAAQRSLGKIQTRLREAGLSDRAINWVRPENIHLTLKFLGDVEDADITAVCKATSAAAIEFPPFDFEIASIGCFPPDGSARVLWAGVAGGAEKIEPVQKLLDEKLHELGFPLDNRRYTPHVTLARIKNTRTGWTAHETVDGLSIPTAITQSVENLTVFQSVLARGGPSYTPMHHADLA